jgi:hypothetical protein
MPSSGVQVNYFSSFQTFSVDSSAKFIYTWRQAAHLSPWTCQVTKNTPCTRIAGNWYGNTKPESNFIPERKCFQQTPQTHDCSFTDFKFRMYIDTDFIIKLSYSGTSSEWETKPRNLKIFLVIIRCLVMVHLKGLRQMSMERWWYDYYCQRKNGRRIDMKTFIYATFSWQYQPTTHAALVACYSLP